MKVIVYENPNTLNEWFSRPDCKIPFLATDLLSFYAMGFLRLASDIGEEAEIYIPETWKPLLGDIAYFKYYHTSTSQAIKTFQKREYELVFLSSLYSLFIGDMDKADVSHLKQNPEKLFLGRGVIGGYLKKGQELPEPESFPGFDCFVTLTEDNYLRINQDLVSNLSTKSIDEVSARVYGKPLILSSQIGGNTTICAPCYIGKDVVVLDSYIGPGTILRGQTRITNSRVFGSYLEDVEISECTLTETVSSSSSLDGVEFDIARLPSGSVIRGARKI